MNLKSRHFVCVFLINAVLGTSTSAVGFVGAIVDDATGKPIAARVYVQNANSGEFLFVETDSDDGSALPYREQWVPMENSIERHTTVSAHPFRVDLAPGRYSLIVERGKEYSTFVREVTIAVGDSTRRETVRLKRWANMAARGWYSGETHVHRRIPELPNVMLAEDLNVAVPVTFWTTNAYEAPHLKPSTLRSQGPSPFGDRLDKGYAPINVDETHVILPRNTEYEVFSVDGKRHTLGAMFLLNHKSVFTAGAPPVGLIAAQAHGEGALIDLDKHSWPWSMMLVPIAKVDLYELSNNSVWRTEFGFKTSAVPWADYMSVETDGAGMTERGWLDFGFENYYTLLNCGFRLQPTAGTASGVHPVPLGYSRVYADVEGNFSSDAWLQALKVGRSFVTNGPMLIARANGKTHGHVFASDDSVTLQIDGEAWFDHPLAGVELIKNGRAEPVSAYSEETTNGVFRLRFSAPVTVEETSWIALRCFENRTDGRVRFAHTSPWHIEIGKQSIRPRKVEVAYLIERMKREIARSNGVLHDDAMAEFQKALEIYEAIASRAR